MFEAGAWRVLYSVGGEEGDINREDCAICNKSLTECKNSIFIELVKQNLGSYPTIFFQPMSALPGGRTRIE